MNPMQPFQMPPYPNYDEFQGGSIEEWWDLYQDHEPNIRFSEPDGYVITWSWIRYSWRERIKLMLGGNFRSGKWIAHRIKGVS